MIKAILITFILLLTQISMASPSRVVALGDLHGDLEAFLAILQQNRLIDNSGHWTGGSTQLVVVGDYHDRGPDTRYIMDYFMELESEITSAGGEFKVIMGNHEMLVMSADLRYVTDEELESFEGFPVPKLDKSATEIFERNIYYAKNTAGQGFAPTFKLPSGKVIRKPLPEKSRDEVEGFVAAHFRDSVYANWVVKGEAMIKVGDTLFVHGGLTEWASQISFRVVNQMIQTWAKFFLGLGPMPNEKTTGWVMGEVGPLWDRTLAEGDSDSIEVAGRLKFQDVKRLVLGHTPQEQVVSLYNGQVFVIDTGNSKYYKGRLSSIEMLDGQEPVASYADRTKETDQLRKSLVCKYRTQQGKKCAGEMFQKLKLPGR